MKKNFSDRFAARAGNTGASIDIAIQAVTPEVPYPVSLLCKIPQLFTKRVTFPVAFRSFFLSVRYRMKVPASGSFLPAQQKKRKDWKKPRIKENLLESAFHEIIISNRISSLKGSCMF